MNTPFPKSVANAKIATPLDISKAETEISKAIAGLVLGQSADAAFFACLVMNTPRIFDQRVGTAAMGAKVMKLNPLFVNNLANTAQRQFLLCHEVLHKALHHIARMQPHHDPRAANQAMDKCINDFLINAGIGEFIPGGVTQDGAREKLWEDLYVAPPPGRGNGPGDKYGDGEGGYGIGDDIDQSPVSEAEIKELENEVRVQVAQAARAAKTRGTMSAALSRLVDEITISKTPWWDKLRHLMTSIQQGDYSWARPNRRYIGAKLYLPAVMPEPAMGLVVFGVDTSGSIGQEELNRFLGEVNKVLSDTTPEKVKFIWCDAEAYEGEEFVPEDYPIRADMVRAQGGGGTSFKPVFEMVDKLGLQPDVLIYLTDGYGDQSEMKTAPEYPVIWVTTDREDDFHFGEVIKMED